MPSFVRRCAGPGLCVLGHDAVTLRRGMQVKCASCERSVYVGDPPPGGMVEVSCEGCLTELVVTSAGEVRLAKKAGLGGGFAPLAAPAAPLPGIPAAPRP